MMSSATQANTIPTSVESILRHPDFVAGFDEVRAGRPFDTSRTTFEYERGRQFGCIAPLSMRLFHGRRLNLAAVGLFVAALKREWLL